MRKFICIKSNKVCKRGTWFFAEEEGEPLYRAEVTPSGKLVQTSRVGIPWDTLAQYILEPGFTLIKPRGSKGGKPPTGTEVSRQIEEFQREFEDIIDEELNRREREDSLSLSSRSGIVVPKDLKPNA